MQAILTVSPSEKLGSIPPQARAAGSMNPVPDAGLSGIAGTAIAQALTAEKLIREVPRNGGPNPLN
jgi:hypothetical protein